MFTCVYVDGGMHTCVCEYECGADCRTACVRYGVTVRCVVGITVVYHVIGLVCGVECSSFVMVLPLLGLCIRSCSLLCVMVLVSFVLAGVVLVLVVSLLVLVLRVVVLVVCTLLLMISYVLSRFPVSVVIVGVGVVVMCAGSV